MEKMMGFRLVYILEAAALAVGTFLCSDAYADSAKLTNPANNHAYQRFDALKSWAESKTACDAQSGHLVTITSQAENEWVWVNLGRSAPFSDTYIGRRRAVWLGGTDMLEEGHWKWVSGETWDYTNWHPGEPEDGGGIGEDYAVMWDVPGYEGKWVDAGLPYADLKIPHICEWDKCEGWPPNLSALISAKTGTQDARTWAVTLSNKSYCPGQNAQIDGLKLTQTYGVACTPVITSPTAFPLALGDIAANGKATGAVTINFSACPSTARFTARITYSANDGAVKGTKTLNNQFR